MTHLFPSLLYIYRKEFCMTKTELVKILYALKAAYGNKEGNELFKKIIRFMYH